MCGHVGLFTSWTSGFLERDVKAFEEMLYIDALRGEDATGVCAINTFSGATVLKEAVHSAWFLYDKEYNEERKNWTKNGKALLGHNRKATMGGRKDENAHPFMYDDRFVFFHNGTLHSYKHLSDTDVDSDALGAHLTKCEGDVEKLSEALLKVHGAYACVWYDAEKNTVYFLRNEQRPLQFIITESGPIAYASEAWMAIGPLSRAGLKIKEVKDIAVNTLYSIDLNDTTLVIKEQPLPKKVQASYIPTLHTGSGMPLTKREAKTIVGEFKSAAYIGFFPDEAVCAYTEKPSEHEVYDWMVMGTNPEYEGVIFKCIIKNKFKREIDDLLTGRYITSMYDKHEYKAGDLMVWVNNVHWTTKENVWH